jgi:hypothetical protein
MALGRAGVPGWYLCRYSAGNERLSRPLSILASPNFWRTTWTDRGERGRVNGVAPEDRTAAVGVREQPVRDLQPTFS